MSPEQFFPYYLALFGFALGCVIAMGYVVARAKWQWLFWVLASAGVLSASMMIVIPLWMVTTHVR